MSSRWTRKGILAIATGTSALAAGIVFANGLVLLIGSTVAFLVLRSLLQPLEAAIQVETTLDHERVVEGGIVNVVSQVGLRSTANRVMDVRHPLHPALRVSKGDSAGTVRLKGAKSVRFQFDLECPITGTYDVGRIEARVRDALGFREVRLDAGQAAPLIVWPKREELATLVVRSVHARGFSGMHPVRRPGVGTTFHALRDYVASDEMRMVDWKASARRPSLVVREKELESSAEATVFLDARQVTSLGTIENNGLLHSVRAAASVAEALLDTRHSVRLVVYGGSIQELHPGTGERHLRRFLDQLASANGKGTQSFEHAVDAVLPHLKPQSAIFLMSSLLRDPSVATATARLLAQNSSVTVISPSPLGHVAAIDAIAFPQREAMEGRIADQRGTGLDRLRAVGAVVVDWEGTERLEARLAKEAVA